MSGGRQIWLVALREMRERSRSRALQLSLIIMVLVVVGAVALPSLLDPSDEPRDVGLTGAVPDELPDNLEDQGELAGITIRVHRPDDVAAGESAVRDGDLDVLVVDGRRLEWPRQRDESLGAVVAGAIQLVEVRERAAAAGVDPDAVLALVAPVEIEDVELGVVAGRGPDDETAALLMTLLLFIAISTYANMVLSGVVEEKANRVVEVLLARMPARSLVAGKVVGIGLIGLAQFGITAVAAFVAVAMVDAVDVPAVRGGVLAWAVVWFVLGYALYATLYGAAGSLASRTEDAQTVGGPVIAVLIAGYFVSFAAVGSPETTWAQLVALFPLTAPLAMPSRIAMGVAEWWEPVVAVVLTVAAIAALVQLGGRVYAHAILHTGPTLRLRDAWRGRPTSGGPGGGLVDHAGGAADERSGIPPVPPPGVDGGQEIGDGPVEEGGLLQVGGVTRPGQDDQPGRGDGPLQHQ
jgi:ABC-2 type transport system permease protein